MSNQIVKMDFNEIQSVSKAMAASGYFSDTKDAAQAIVKIMAGVEMGLGPFAAMSGIHIIQGKPVLGANLIASLIKNDPRYDYRVVQLDETTCSIDFFQGGENIGTSTMTMAEAKKGGTKNLDKYPRNMLFARAISNGAKWYTPGIFGGAPAYTPDEFGMETDSDGDPVVIRGTVREVPMPAPAPVDEQLPNVPDQREWNATLLAAIVQDGHAENVHNAKAMLNLSIIDPTRHPENLLTVCQKWAAAYRQERGDKETDEAASAANARYLSYLQASA